VVAEFVAFTVNVPPLFALVAVIVEKLMLSPPTLPRSPKLSEPLPTVKELLPSAEPYTVPTPTKESVAFVPAKLTVPEARFAVTAAAEVEKSAVAAPANETNV
jgi:hypothetical protein